MVVSMAVCSAASWVVPKAAMRAHKMVEMTAGKSAALKVVN